MRIFIKDQALAQLGHEVVILSYRRHPFFSNWGYQTVDESGIHAVSYNFLPGRLLGSHGAKLRVRFEQWGLRKAYLRALELYGKPDVIDSHYLFITTIACCLKERFHIPLVAIEHWSVMQQKHLPVNVLRMAESQIPTLFYLKRGLTQYGTSTLIHLLRLAHEYGNNPLIGISDFICHPIKHLFPQNNQEYSKYEIHD